MDFFAIRARNTKRGIEIYPDFIVGNHDDFMVRGHAFYAIFDKSTGMWSTDETMVQKIVDSELYEYAQKQQDEFEGVISVQYMANFSSNSWSKYKKYLKESVDNYVPLDQTLTFQNQVCKKEDYVSKRLPYCLEDGDHSAWDELVGTLYSDEEREKIEWAIGSVVSGDSKRISKFFVLYGAPGSGKGTILDIIAKLFKGYYGIIESKALGNRTSEFSTAAFRDNPLVALEYDSDLSKIENNTRLNSIISHETIPVRELYKAAYNVKINALIFLATNSPVQITDSKSGIIRRLVDINPSGLKIPSNRYVKLIEQINFELGSIAQHCLNVYKKLGLHYYDAYRSIDMMERTDIFFNFVEESYFTFKQEDGVSLKRAWSMYKEYSEESGLQYLMPKHRFKQELREYFDKFIPDTKLKDGTRIKNYYRGFLSWKVDGKKDITMIADDGDIFDFEPPPWLQLSEEAALDSILDAELRDCPAQYANETGTPFIKWENVKGTLKMLNTHFLHYVLMPDNYIVIDFDLKDPETGEKSAKLNLEAASHWPPTYAEFSKSGAGLHLHYIYGGDVNLLKSIYSDDIEIKVFKGNSSLRRQLTKCNKIPIRTISSGLPLREEKRVINHEAVKSERKLRELISRCLEKEFGATKPSVDFINHLLVEAKESGLSYDVSDMKQAIMIFAMNSTHQAEYCMKLASEMPYKSEEPSSSGNGKYADDRLVFFDVEVFPNLFLINWKFAGSSECVRMVNPTPEEVGELFNYKLVGFNNRRYDNHILYARYIGYNNEELYILSQKIVSNDRNVNATFSEAYNLSYTDVYDFASAGHKKSLKKWEIELGLHHQELGLPWDQPVPEEQWSLVAEYCDNDVISTEAVFNHLSGDFRAREILADIAGMTVNDSTNSLTTRIIFGKEKKPKLNWYDLAEEFPGYQYKSGKNMYRGDDVGRGGWVYANPGMYGYCKTFDVASMHPRSIIEERYLGEYTDRFEDLVNIRLFIKHGDYDSVAKLFDGKLRPYLNNKNEAKDLSNALKTAINSVYGLTSASFDNPFRDRRNKNNIVALRGALFMRTLQDEVESRGFTVVHIKTDSIKIADPTPDIEQFVYEFGKKYGYTFEVEAEWEKLCLVNNAVFIGKQTVTSPQAPGKWTATGKQFQEPYVFKKIFSHEPITFDDMCITMTCKSAFYLDMNEQLPEGSSMPVFIGRAGSFCPIESGYGGGILLRAESDGRLSAASGTKGYRFLEAETVRGTDLEKHVDRSYFEKLVDDAITDISKYGDFYSFAADGIDIPWAMPCGDLLITSCKDCPHYIADHSLCDLGFDISDVLLRM